MPDEKDALRGVFNISIIGNDSLDMDLFRDTRIENLNHMHTDFNIIYEDIIRLADRELYTVLFTFRDDENTFKRQEIWTIDTYPRYLLTYQVDQTYYDDYADVVEQMIDSLVIVDTNGFNKFVGTWVDEEKPEKITFFSNGTFISSHSLISGNKGTFELYPGKLVLNFSDVEIMDRLGYTFSNNDNTLTLTQLPITVNGSIITIVLTKE